MAKISRDWVVVGPEPWLAHCTRCGGGIPKPVLPCSMEAMQHYLAYASRLHAGCQLGGGPLIGQYFKTQVPTAESAS